MRKCGVIGFEFWTAVHSVEDVKRPGQNLLDINWKDENGEENHIFISKGYCNA